MNYVLCITHNSTLITQNFMTRLIKWTPFMEEPFEEFDKLFNAVAPVGGVRGFVPAVDVYETKDAVVVETPLAGIDPEKVDVSIENDMLTVKGEQEQKSEVEEKNYYRKEVRAGSFYRTVALPTHVVGDKASASYENGILTISVPKAPEAKAKTVKVKVVRKK